MQLILVEAIASQVVAYVTQQVERAIADPAVAPDERRQGYDAELIRTRTEPDHIADAIRRRIISTTRAMLENAERWVGELDAASRTVPDRSLGLPLIAEVVEDYLRDLRDTLEENIPAARELLARGIGTVTLRPLGGQLVTEIHANPVGLHERANEKSVH